MVWKGRKVEIGGVDNLEKMEKLINWLFLLGERIRVSGKGIEFSLEWDVL